MNKYYYIYTDSGSEEIQAETLSAALTKWCQAPVDTADGFETWLVKNGGYGGIQENGLQITNVRP